MIKDKDRSGWFGASDTDMVVGNWNTPSFERWWLEKLGVTERKITTLAMMTGTAYEHRILDAIGVKKRDRQIKRRHLRLRVNLDGEDRREITEVKTTGKPFRVSRTYWRQCQVEMYAAKKKCRIAAYRLEPEDYKNWLRPIDLSRVSYHPIDYDPEWIHAEYLPRLKYLARCLKKGVWPDYEDYSSKL